MTSSTDDDKGVHDDEKQGLFKAVARLDRDVERLQERINTERFIFIVFAVAFFDAVAFAFYKNWAAPVCITALEFAALFVLAKHFGVSEIISLFFEIVRSWGKREIDPPEDDKAGA